MRLVPALIVVAVAVASTASAKLPPPPTEAAVVPTGAAPCGIAVHGNGLWVAVYEAGVLLRIDSSGRVTRRVRVGRYACHVEVGKDAVWVARDRASRVVRVDARTARRRSVAVPGEPFDVLLAAGSLWVASWDTGNILRLDPDTGRIRDRIAVGAKPVGLAWCQGRVWAGHGGDLTTVTSIDPKAGSIRDVETAVPSPRAPVCIRGVLWVATPDSVVRIDARTGRLLSVLPLGETLGNSAAAPDGTVWVTDKQHSVVHRLTSDGALQLDSFPAGPGAFALARFAGSMWITSFAGSDVRRYDP